MNNTCEIAWDDVIKASNEYIDILKIKMHNMDSVDCKFKEMWHQKLALALCRHQEIAVLQQAQEAHNDTNMQ
jgi:hypothetical protein